ncbi:hypothetical protein B0T16DRAFT_462326 [Cercophora newfieldiana]|uniref:Uncharacterized protein n=1 Tax=Cercophora newfieldiana TaxID=92897 RepID=A0AA40CH11_9PEZI|nr:hypothetical protein B0T16DRAFT_462326 [Cercophora newfieldiana]
MEATLACRIPKRVLEEVPRRMVELKGGLRMGDLMDELWMVEFGREYPWAGSESWCAWRMPEEMRRELWKYTDYGDSWGAFDYGGDRFRMPVTELSKWADSADFVIGGFIPCPGEYHDDELCGSCMGVEGKLTKRCRSHLVKQQRYRCQGYRPREVLSLNPSS